MLDHREELDVEVAVISFAITEMLRLYCDEHGLDEVRPLTGVDRAAYAAFGFARAGARVWPDPRVPSLDALLAARSAA